ncbi:phthiocerol/phthiodiolone dimycocerosyl transferase family protein [Amycolatopsis speibonae]|uniref:Phthiocerol/phthiodiolone dimycocerosyl transferase n=1 Tax=Amycolatopsis speibonae TaxID=1450224 RepID=A0ABV7PD16_9PSEU
MAGSGVGPVFALARVGETVDARILADALEILATEHPLLRGKVVGDRLRVGEHGPELVVGGDLLTEITTSRPGVARALLSGLDVVLGVEHAFADGRFCVTMLYRLLDLYARLAAGCVVRPNPAAPLESPLDVRLSGRYHHFDDLPEPPPRVDRLPAGRTDATGYGVRTLVFGPAATTGLLTAARRTELSVHALLGGLLSAALCAELDAGPCVLLVTSSVDLRPRLARPVRSYDGLNCIGDIPAVLKGPADPVGFGWQLLPQLRSGLAREVPQRRFAMVFCGPGPLTAFPPASLAISNLGRLDSPGYLGITSIRFLTTAPGPTPLIFVTTVDGRLTIDVTYDRAHVCEARVVSWTTHVQRLLRTAREW